MVLSASNREPKNPNVVGSFGRLSESKYIVTRLAFTQPIKIVL